MKDVDVRGFLQRFTAWAKAQPDILAVALVGSYARGTARPDSDVDLVILTAHPIRYLSDVSWAASFGEINRYQIEDYGLVTSLRVWYSAGLEVEYGLTDERWVAIPLDEGTRQVISDGMTVRFEQGDILSRHQNASAA